MIKKTIKNILIVITFFLSFTAFFSAKWYVDIYGNIGFRSILFTLLSPMQGTAGEIVYDWLLKGLLPSVICTPLLTAFYFSKIKIKKVLKKIICLIVCLSLWFYGIAVTGLPEFLIGALSKTDIYDTHYQNPSNTKITFPKEKQNLVYILLESMETTYLSQNEGGGLDENIIPELYNLAKANTNFSHNQDVGGWEFIPNTSWTSAAIVAQTSGVPYTPPITKTIPKSDSNFLPSITTLNDILHQNGYKQTVMFGSVASYGSRDTYFLQHSVDKILDYNTAKKDKIIPNDYHVWWGMEDKKLFEYAKKELLSLANEEQPFCFTLLTADTHHISGYICDECENKYDSKYKNVLACSSKQVSNFVDWLKSQDFYNNTTVIVIGDHLSMDAQFFRESMEKDYTRRVYNCFINSKTEAKNPKNRIFTPMDILPTALASIGCEIEGERLGLGTNLFSDKQTLAEQITLERFKKEMTKCSDYYNKSFLN